MRCVQNKSSKSWTAGAIYRHAWIVILRISSAEAITFILIIIALKSHIRHTNTHTSQLKRCVIRDGSTTTYTASGFVRVDVNESRLENSENCARTTLMAIDNVYRPPFSVPCLYGLSRLLNYVRVKVLHFTLAIFNLAATHVTQHHQATQSINWIIVRVWVLPSWQCREARLHLLAQNPCYTRWPEPEYGHRIGNSYYCLWIGCVY